MATLYSYWRSSCSWRVRIALIYKNIPYKYVAVPLLEGKQRTPEYIQLNPNKVVPTLEIDGHVLNQSLAILEYLEETHPNFPLLPKEPALRAKVREIMQLIGSDIQPLQNLRVGNKVAELTGDEGKKAVWTKYHIESGFESLEATLAKSAGKYCVGDSITFADVVLVPQVYAARRFNVAISSYPNIARIEASLSAEESFKRAHADSQPDTPPPK